MAMRRQADVVQQRRDSDHLSSEDIPSGSSDHGGEDPRPSHMIE
jgi:hypothetical protein